MSAYYDVLVIAFQGRKPFKSFVTGGPNLLKGLFSSHHNDGDDHDDDDRTRSKAQSGDGSWSSFSTFPECEPGGKRKSCKELFSCQVEKVMAAL